MPSKREQVLGVLFARLETALSATVRRNKVLPERVPVRHLRGCRSLVRRLRRISKANAVPGMIAGPDLSC